MFELFTVMLVAIEDGRKGRGHHSTLVFLITRRFVYFVALIQIIIVKNVVPQFWFNHTSKC